jgi:sigma-54 dependent transcriptional regulator, flagellar regulatory protein
MKSTTLVRKSRGADDLIVGNSVEIRNLRDLVRRVAGTSVSIMIHGPSGAGKEMVARAIHAQSDRAAKPFVAINCGAIPSELIESELFGHERGAFTGASQRRIGRFEEANGGTLFLDEIGDMRFDMQVKLLRVLEDGIITRVGDNTPIPVDVRILSATHQDIHAAIAASRFREDLFFRIGVIPVTVPPLAGHPSDIPHLVSHFQERMAARSPAQFDARGLARLSTHDWPGNVRELRNVIERANALFPGETIGWDQASLLVGGGRRLSEAPSRSADSVLETMMIAPDPSAHPDAVLEMDRSSPIDLRKLLETMELDRINAALNAADGVISEAARLLTLKRTTLVEKMRKYGMTRYA